MCFRDITAQTIWTMDWNNKRKNTVDKSTKMQSFVFSFEQMLFAQKSIIKNSYEHKEVDTLKTQSV